MTLKMRPPPSPSSSVYEIGPPDFNTPDGLTFVGEDAGVEIDQTAFSVRRKGKGKEVPKRAPPVGSESDSDVPISAKRPPTKKRRVERDGTDVTEDRYSVIDEPIPMGASPANKLLSNAKGRGKGKQREQSVDSATATPKGRKKPGPKKKMDNFPPTTQEILGLGSNAPSVAGDVTPSGSRPPSPTLTSVSATMYELDETIPALKRARKVDDAAMIKRVKNLEDAQRKVWQNIARRDVAKVRKTRFV